MSSISVLANNTDNLGLFCAGLFSVLPVLLVLLCPDCGGRSVQRTHHDLAAWEQQGELKTYFFGTVTRWKVISSDFLKNSPIVPVMEISFLSNVFGCCAREGELWVAADGRKTHPCSFEKELPGVCQKETEAKPHSPVAGIALLHLLPDKAACSKQFLYLPSPTELSADVFAGRS